MRRVTALLSAAAVVVWMTAAFAQTPNFAGTWTRDAGAAPAGGGGGGAAGGGGGGGGQRQGGGGGGGGLFACGMECTIVQDAKTITIKRAAGQGGQAPADVVLNLTGDSKIAMGGRPGGTPAERTITAKADGGKWVLTSTSDMGGTSVTSTSTLSVAGNKLTIVNTSNRDGATPQTQTYTKK